MNLTQKLLALLSGILMLVNFAYAQAEMSPGKTFSDCPGCPEMVVIPSGSFNMGSIKGDADEGPVHRVTFKRTFAMSKTEVTQGQWKEIMGNNRSTFNTCGDDCPVEQVSWNDAQAFIQKLNAKTGKQYRLPTEAEWEYACYGVSLPEMPPEEDVEKILLPAYEYCGEKGSDLLAWTISDSDGITHRVGQKLANSFGLYDMSGNVWEWVEDSYHDSYNGATTDGSAWKGDGEKRVIRGGSWYNRPQDVRAAIRGRMVAGFRDNGIGFRLVRMLP